MIPWRRIQTYTGGGRQHRAEAAAIARRHRSTPPHYNPACNDLHGHKGLSGFSPVDTITGMQYRRKVKKGFQRACAWPRIKEADGPDEKLVEPGVRPAAHPTGASAQ